MRLRRASWHAVPLHTAKPCFMAKLPFRLRRIAFIILAAQPILVTWSERSERSLKLETVCSAQLSAASPVFHSPPTEP